MRLDEALKSQENATRLRSQARQVATMVQQAKEEAAACSDRVSGLRERRSQLLDRLEMIQGAVEHLQDALSCIKQMHLHKAQLRELQLLLEQDRKLSAQQGLSSDSDLESTRAAAQDEQSILHGKVCCCVSACVVVLPHARHIHMGILCVAT